MAQLSPNEECKLVDSTYVYDLLPLRAGIHIRERAPAAHSLDGTGAKAFRERAADDVTGASVWGSSVLLARCLLLDALCNFEGKSVLELGAGCGLAGLAAAQRFPGPSECTLSDVHDVTLENLTVNVALNTDSGHISKSGCHVGVVKMDWDDSSTWPTTPDGGSANPDSPESRPTLTQFDVILAGDGTYKRSYARKLFHVVEQTLKPGGSFVYASPWAREGLPLLQQLLLSHGYSVHPIAIPAEWRGNPLREASSADGSDEGCSFVSDAQSVPLFPELAMSGYEFEMAVFVKPMEGSSATPC